MDKAESFFFVLGFINFLNSFLLVVAVRGKA